MNKKAINGSLVFIIVIVLLIWGVQTIFNKTAPCFDDTKKTGRSQSSSDLNFAVTNNLLVEKIELTKKSTRLNSNTNLDIDESWIETDWSYECIGNEIQIVKSDELKHLVISLKNISWVDHFHSYSIELGGQNFGTNNGNLIISANDLHDKKILIYQLKEKYKFKGNKTIIDSIMIK